MTFFMSDQADNKEGTLQELKSRIELTEKVADLEGRLRDSVDLAGRRFLKNQDLIKEKDQATRKIIQLDAEMFGLREKLRTANAVGSVSRDRTFALTEAVKKNHELLDERAELKEEVASLKVQLEKSRKAVAGSFIGTWRGCDILLKGATTIAVETFVRHIAKCGGIDASEHDEPKMQNGTVQQAADSWFKYVPATGAESANPKQAFGDKKPPHHLIPPAADHHASLAFKDGAAKYGAYNWRENAVEAMTYIGAMRRHIAAYLNGEDSAPDSGVHHLGHVLASAGILLDADEQGMLIDNRPRCNEAAK